MGGDLTALLWPKPLQDAQRLSDLPVRRYGAQTNAEQGAAVLDREKFVALVSSGAIWTVGSALGLRIGPVFVLVAAVYVLVGSWALARSAKRAAVTLAILWCCAVALLAVVFAPVAGLFTIVLGLLFGTLAFGAWTSTGFLLLHFFTRGPRTARP